MNEMIQSLVAHGGLVLFVIVFVEQAGVPFPAAPWLLAAGALSASGGMNVAVAIGLSVLACVTADSLWFYVGRRSGSRVLKLFGRFSLAPDSRVEGTKSLLSHQRLRGLVIAKFLPGLGAVIPPLAGALGVSAAHFLLFDSLGSFLYGAFYIVVGFLLHDQLQQVLAALKQLGFSALLLVLVLVLAYLAFKYVERRPFFRRSTVTKRQEVREPGVNVSLRERKI
jgi:membrane protein DedA with SNARE-associated domain